MLSEGRERAFLMTTAGGSGPSRLPGRERPRDRFVKLACFERRRSAWEHLEAETRQTAMVDLGCPPVLFSLTSLTDMAPGNSLAPQFSRFRVAFNVSNVFNLSLRPRIDGIRYKNRPRAENGGCEVGELVCWYIR